MSKKSTDLVEAISRALEYAIKGTPFEIDSDVEVSTILGKASFVLILDEDHPLTYELLDMIGEKFKTNKINIGSEERTRWLSSMTGEGYGVIKLSISGATIPEIPPPPEPVPPPVPPSGYILVAGGPILASAWARGRQCKEGEAFYYAGVDAEIDHLSRKTFKVVSIGPKSKKKDEQLKHLLDLGFRQGEE